MNIQTYSERNPYENYWISILTFWFNKEAILPSNESEFPTGLANDVLNFFRVHCTSKWEEIWNINALIKYFFLLFQAKIYAQERDKEQFSVYETKKHVKALVSHFSVGKGITWPFVNTCQKLNFFPFVRIYASKFIIKGG